MTRKFRPEYLECLVSRHGRDQIEEADYEGDFLSIASRIANALHRRVEVRLVPVEGKESVGVTA